MPNHVTNILRICGDESLVSKIKKEISSGIGEIVSFIDFNKIDPLPEELRETFSPPRIISREDYEKQESERANGNKVDRGITEEMWLDFEKRFGASCWYDWQKKNWGTKWNAYSQTLEKNGDIRFKTAWSTPSLLMIKLSVKYPEAEFFVRFACEDTGYNVGEYKTINGIFIPENFPVEGSEKAIEMAIEISESRESIREYLEGAEEGDDGVFLDSKYTKAHLMCAYRLRIFGKYKNFVWKAFIQVAKKEKSQEALDELIRMAKLSSSEILKELSLWDDSLDYAENIRQSTTKFPEIWNKIYIPEDFDPQHNLGFGVMKRIGAI
jgi:hypothetical protein